jgi:hypothetical protein
LIGFRTFLRKATL